MKLNVSTLQSLANLLAGTAVATIAIALPGTVWAAQSQPNFTGILALSEVRSLRNPLAHRLILPIFQNTSCPNNEPRSCPPHGTR